MTKEKLKELIKKNKKEQKKLLKKLETSNKNGQEYEEIVCKIAKLHFKLKQLSIGGKV